MHVSVKKGPRIVWATNDEGGFHVDFLENKIVGFDEDATVGRCQDANESARWSLKPSRNVAYRTELTDFGFNGKVNSVL